VSSVPEPDSDPEEPSPLGSWRRAYALVLIELGVVVLLLYALARWAA